jgi:hypothetical protein
MWSAQSIGKQLVEDGWIVARNKDSFADRSQIRIKVPNSVPTFEGKMGTFWAWSIDATKLKFEIKKIIEEEEEY